MPICVLGAGSVGLGIAATLVEADAKVSLLARGKYVQRLQSEGIHISGVLGEHLIKPGDFAVEDATNSSPVECDLLIITTKTYEVATALKAIRPRLASTPAILLLQNGWGTADEAKQIMPPGTPIFSGILMVGLERTSPSSMKIHAYGDATRIGSLFGADQRAMEVIFGLPRPGFIPFIDEPNIEPVILTKLIYNMCLNPLGALRHCSYGDLMRNEETLGIMIRIANEAIKVLGAARGFSRFADGETYVRGELVPKWLAKVGPHRSSMLQDLEAGHKTEIAYLNGAVCAMARQFGIETPHNDAIVRQIEAAEQAAKNHKARA